MRAPTLFADGEEILREGDFVDPSLVPHARHLRALFDRAARPEAGEPKEPRRS